MHMKKQLLFVCIFLVALCLTGFSADQRKTLLVYTKGYAPSTGLVETQVNQEIVSLGKYRLVTRDDVVFREISMQLSGILEGGNAKEIQQLKADAVIFIQVNDENGYQKFSKDGKTSWIDYEINTNYKLIDVASGQVLTVKTFVGTGSSNITPNAPYSQAMKNAKYNAVYNVANEIVMELNTLFKIKGSIVNITSDGRVTINVGKDIGVYEGMVFQFAKDVTINEDKFDTVQGKLLATDVKSSTSILKILELPKDFAVSDQGVYITETPNMSALRSRLALNGGMYGIKYPVFNFDVIVDNYQGLAFGMNIGACLANINSKNVILLDTGFMLGYMIDLDAMEATIPVQFGMLYDLSTDDIDKAAFSLYIKPGLKIAVNLGDFMGAYAQGGYIFEIPMNSIKTNVNGITLQAGVEFKF